MYACICVWPASRQGWASYYWGGGCKTSPPSSLLECPFHLSQQNALCTTKLTPWTARSCRGYYCTTGQRYIEKAGIALTTARYLHKESSSSAYIHTCIHMYVYNIIIYIYYMPPHSASCLSTSGVCAPVGRRKVTTSANCNGWHLHWLAVIENMC